MLIRVQYHNHRYDLVQDYYLEALLTSGRVRRFQRQEGWVRTDNDRLRQAGNAFYTGPERRRRSCNRPLDQPVFVDGRVYRPLFPDPPM